MEDSSLILILLIVILMLLSGFFSATETAFSSLNRIRLKSLAEDGSKKAEQTLTLADRYDTVLSTILVGNNIVNIAMASIATVLFVNIFGDIGVTLSTIVITILVLIFSEVSPKTLAKEAPESFAMFATPSIRLLIVLFSPINWFFNYWKKFLSAVFKTKDDPSITEEELLTMVEEAQQEGAISQEDKELIDNVIEFNDSKVLDILTPRVDIQAIPLEADTNTITSVFLETGFSRIPVYEETLDSIIGVIHLRDFFNLVVKDQHDIKEILSDVIYVTTTTQISNLLNQFQQSKTHFAVVINEYGGTVGIVTMEDVLEELVGEIWDEHDEIIEEFVKINDHQYKATGRADLDRVLETFELEEDEFKSTTVNGWIMENLDRIPETGDQFDYKQLHVEITKAENHRVEECIITVAEVEYDELTDEND